MDDRGVARDVEDEDVDDVALGSRPVTGGFFAAMVDMVGGLGFVVLRYRMLRNLDRPAGREERNKGRGIEEGSRG